MANITQNFWQKNQIFIVGALSAISLALQQFIGAQQIEWEAIGLACLLALAGYFGNTLRGKGVTIAGFLGVAGNAFYIVQTTGHFTFSQFILSTVIGLLALVAPPPKNIGYEMSSTIIQAKTQGEKIEQTQKETPPPQI